MAPLQLAVTSEGGKLEKSHSPNSHGTQRRNIMLTQSLTVDYSFNIKKFKPTNKQTPCPVCGDTTGKCRTTDGDLILCMTYDHEVPGWHYLGQTKDFLWGKFVPKGDRPSPRPLPQVNIPTKTIVPADTWDKTYRRILDQLFLSDRHLQDFHTRKLTVPEIAKLGTVARSLSDGYLIPFPDVSGRYVGAQKRLDVPGDGGRYRWYYPDYNWSLNNQFNEKPLAVWQNGDPVWIIEGAGLKPLVASVRHGITAIGGVGGQHYLSPQTMADTLNQLGNPRTIVFCPDAGDIVNKQVVRRICQNLNLLTSMGIRVRIAWWGQFSKGHHDIDEIPNLNNVRYITPQEFWSLTRPEFRPVGVEVEPQHKDDVPTFNDRLTAYQQAGATIILDQSATGSGKSHFDSELKPADLGVKKIFYVTNDPYNPTIKGFEDWVHMKGRHGGLKTIVNSDGTTRLVRCKPGEPYTIEPNCIRSDAVEFLRNANVDGSDTASVICGTCPMREQCAHSSGGVDFLAQRRKGLSADRVICHPESLPDPKEFNYGDVAIILDDTMPRAIQQIQVYQNDVARTIADHPELAKEVANLYKAMGGNLPRYGLDTAQVIELSNIDLDPEYLEALTAPDLGKALNPVADQGVDLSDLPADQRRFYSSDVTEGVKKISKQWLADYARVCQGLLGGSLTLANNGTLTITLPDPRFRKIVNAAKLSIFQDATTTKQSLSLRLGVAPETIAAMKQSQPGLDNLELIQISDLGTVTRQYGNDQKRRIEAIIKEVSSHGKTGVIGFKKHFENYWHRDNRGSNNFLEMENLILVGTPYMNLGAALAEYSAMRGERVSKEDAGFTQWYQEQTRAEIIQGVGRLRANRRTDTKLRVFLISNFEMGWQQVTAESITPLAADKKNSLWQRVKAVGLELMRQGQKVTQAGLAEILNCTQGRISQLIKEFQGTTEAFSELLISLFSPNSKINNLKPDLEPEVTQTLYEMVASSPVGEIFRELMSIFTSVGKDQVFHILNLASEDTLFEWRLSTLRLLT